MRARYYSPELRRFINADPIGFAGGMNWYAYASGDPINYFDPFGTFRLRQFLVGAGQFAGGTILGIVSLAAAPTGIGTAAAVVGATSSGIALTVGLGNMIESFTRDNSSPGVMESAPSNIGGLIGRCVAGEKGQKVGSILESAVNVTSSFKTLFTRPTVLSGNATRLEYLEVLQTSLETVQTIVDFDDLTGLSMINYKNDQSQITHYHSMRKTETIK
jgi:hypothetical protein